MSRSTSRRTLLGVGLVASALLGHEVAKYKRGTRQRFEMAAGPAPGTAAFACLVTAMTGAPLRSGNRVQVMRNGATLDAMIEAISSATETIDCSSYIYWPGATADRFTGAFIERAGAGVEVNLVLDGYGSAKLGAAHRDRLRQGGVNVAIFRPLRWYNAKKLNNRMHRRILVVDGAVAFAGGVGIADVWTGDAQDPEHWRETHLRIEGPAVLDLFGAFAETWTEATRELLVGTHIAQPEPIAGGMALQVTRSTPIGGATAATELFYAAIAGARARLWLTTAYFPPTGASRASSATRHGAVSTSASWSTARRWTRRWPARPASAPTPRCSRPGCGSSSTTGPCCTQVLLVDREWANVGSGNFDSRSLDLDLEINLAILDADVVEELSAHFLDDLEASIEVDPATWSKRPLRVRAAEYATEVIRQSL